MTDTSANASLELWVMCALCSWAFAMVNYKDACFYEIAYFLNFRSQDKNNATTGCPYLFAESSWEEYNVPYEIPDFFLSPYSVGIAFSAFYIGKMLCLVPAGMLSDIGYPRGVLVGGMVLLVIHHFLVPVSLVFGFKSYVVLCSIIGVSESMIYPSILALISQYTPPAHRNTFIVFVVSGIYYGTVMGQVCFNVFVSFVQIRTWILWNVSVGVIGTVWLACWITHSYCCPRLIPNYQTLKCRTSSIGRYRRTLLTTLQRLLTIPWNQIFSSRAFLSLILVYCSFDYASYLNVWRSFVPYQKQILHLPAYLARFSNIPVLAVLPTAFISGLFVDWALRHKVVTNTVLKRSFVFTSVFCSSALQVAMIEAGCDVVLFWALVAAKSYVVGLAVPVIYSAPVDLSPRDAGLLMAILTSASSTCYLFDMEIYRHLVPDVNSWSSWRNGFIYFASMALAMVIPFLFFGSGEHQGWRKKGHNTFNAQGSRKSSAAIRKSDGTIK